MSVKQDTCNKVKREKKHLLLELFFFSPCCPAAERRIHSPRRWEPRSLPLAVTRAQMGSKLHPNAAAFLHALPDRHAHALTYTPPAWFRVLPGEETPDSLAELYSFPA